MKQRKLLMLLQRSYTVDNVENEEEIINQLVNDWEKDTIQRRINKW